MEGHNTHGGVAAMAAFAVKEVMQREKLPGTVAISFGPAEEQLIFQVEMYPAGIMVQNIKMGAEALGLGHWNFCGFNPDILFGAR